MLVSLQPTDDPLNLVLNPGFEKSGPEPWFGIQAAIQVYGVESHSGAHSLWTKERTQDWAGPQQTMLGTLLPGRTYQIACFAKLLSSNSGESQFEGDGVL